MYSKASPAQTHRRAADLWVVLAIAVIVSAATIVSIKAWKADSTRREHALKHGRIVEGIIVPVKVVDTPRLDPGIMLGTPLDRTPRLSSRPLFGMRELAP